MTGPLAGPIAKDDFLYSERERDDSPATVITLPFGIRIFLWVIANIRLRPTGIPGGEPRIIAS